MTTLVPPQRRIRLAHVALLMASGGTARAGTQRKVFDLIEQYPGLHQRELGRRLAISAATVEHHLRHLLRTGLVTPQEDGGYTRYFVAAQGHASGAAGVVDRRDRAALALLRQARPLAIVAHLLQEEPLGMGELAERVGIRPATLTYQVDKLEKEGLVLREQDGKGRRARLADRPRIVRLLLEHEPPDDLAAGFESLWDDVGL